MTRFRLSQTCAVIGAAWPIDVPKSLATIKSCSIKSSAGFQVVEASLNAIAVQDADHAG